MFLQWEDLEIACLHCVCFLVAFYSSSVCVRHSNPVISTRRHPAHPESVLIFFILERYKALWSQKKKHDIEVLHGKAARKCKLDHATPRHGTRYGVHNIHSPAIQVPFTRRREREREREREKRK